MGASECFIDDDDDGGAAKKEANATMKWTAYVSLAIALISFIRDVNDRQRRHWPKRVITCFGGSILLVEVACAIGAATDFSQRNESKNRATPVCLAQGMLFNFGLSCATLLFLSYQLSQYLMLCRGVASDQIRGYEPKVLLLVFGYSATFTIVAAQQHKIFAPNDLYWCFVHEWAFLLFGSQLTVASILSIFWSVQSIRWLRRVASSFVSRGVDSSRAIDNFLFSNIVILVIAFLMLFMGFFSALTLNDKTRGTCFMKSYQFLFYPLLFVVLSRGFQAYTHCKYCYPNDRSASGLTDLNDDASLFSDRALGSALSERASSPTNSTASGSFLQGSPSILDDPLLMGGRLST